jgi:methyl-accepting chemotaxis protein
MTKLDHGISVSISEIHAAIANISEKSDEQVGTIQELSSALVNAMSLVNAFTRGTDDVANAVRACAEKAQQRAAKIIGF